VEAVTARSASPSVLPQEQRTLEALESNRKFWGLQNVAAFDTMMVKAGSGCSGRQFLGVSWRGAHLLLKLVYHGSTRDIYAVHMKQTAAQINAGCVNLIPWSESGRSH
jgi:hypothetical protein